MEILNKVIILFLVIFIIDYFFRIIYSDVSRIYWFWDILSKLK